MLLAHSGKGHCRQRNLIPPHIFNSPGLVFYFSVYYCLCVLRFNSHFFRQEWLASKVILNMRGVVGVDARTKALAAVTLFRCQHQKVFTKAGKSVATD